MSYWAGKKVLITGGSGFIASSVIQKLIASDAKVTLISRKPGTVCEIFEPDILRRIEIVQADLISPAGTSEVSRQIKDIDIVLALAARVGGISYNIQHPASMFRDNMQIAINTLELCRIIAPQRVLVTSSACVYPRFCTIPTPEDEGFIGTPEPTNEGYGWAKRMFEFMATKYREEFGLPIVVVRPYNAYGPRDNFNPSSSHVISGLIYRIWHERQDPLVVWGDGTQSRSFVYVDDLARGILEVVEKYSGIEPLNLGSDEEVTIHELVTMLNDIYYDLNGTRFLFSFDTSKPNGQPRRACDTTRARNTVGFQCRWRLTDGLKETVKWFSQRKDGADATFHGGCRSIR